MPIGTEPAITVSGAAAATTMKTMAPGPSRPVRRWRSGASGARADGGGFETVAMAASLQWARPTGRTALAVEGGPPPPGAGYMTETKVKHPRDIERETAVTLFSFDNVVRVTRGGYARLPVREGAVWRSGAGCRGCRCGRRWPGCAAAG